MGDQEYNSGKKYRQKGTLCGPNNTHGKLLISPFFEFRTHRLNNLLL
jgi:hypothetical protein